jgi:hypothetical protein
MGEGVHQWLQRRCCLIGGGDGGNAVRVEHTASGEDNEPGGDLGRQHAECRVDTQVANAREEPQLALPQAPGDAC